ncbi:creatine kinase U-type, mitochondrial [Exaiptasia diaphana]|uniref:Uncharacterized protein n=1 Tax=Exaiptasia diaphana TaxID=2652724 RepID=A0A913XWR8_EXADI|nr:creatine kinase U-type, mitochondrial [Exaiptasia diaphana]
MSISIDVEELGQIGGISQPKLAVALLAGVGVVSAWYVYRKHCKIPIHGGPSKLYQEIKNSNTILSEHLTPELLLKLKKVETSKGYTLNDLVQNGLNNIKNRQNREPGLIIGDEECYEVFRELIDPLLMKFYGINDMRSLKMECFNKVDWRKVKGGRLLDKRILSCVLCSSRNMSGYPFVSTINNQDREEIAAIFVRVLTRLSVPYRGDYARLCNLAKWQQERLHLFEHYNIPSKEDEAPQGLDLSWPDGRLIWWTEDRRCKAFVNFADHVKFVISRSKGDLQQILKDYMELVSSFETFLKVYEDKSFAWSFKYGYLTSNLTDIGTGLHVEVKLQFHEIHKTEFFERIKNSIPVVVEHSGMLSIFAYL